MLLVRNYFLKTQNRIFWSSTSRARKLMLQPSDQRSPKRLKVSKKNKSVQPISNFLCLNQKGKKSIRGGRESLAPDKLPVKVKDASDQILDAYKNFENKIEQTKKVHLYL